MAAAPRGGDAPVAADFGSPAGWLSWLVLALMACLLVVATLLPADAAELERGAGLLLFPLGLLVWSLVAGLSGKPELSGKQAWWELDWLVWALVGWIVISAVAVSGEGNLRSAVNETWWWVTGALVFTAARVIGGRAALAERLLVLFFALAAGQAMYGAHQHLISLPADQQLFAQEPDRVLAAAGIYAPEGSPERELFRARLESAAPTGTFALANSLAGYLLLGVVLAAGFVAREFFLRGRGVGAGAGEGEGEDEGEDAGEGEDEGEDEGSVGSQGTHWARLLSGLLVIAGCGFALLWTSSRSGLLAAVVGLLCVGYVIWSVIVGAGSTVGKKTWLVARIVLLSGLAAALIVVIVIARQPAMWDSLPRSLAFRFQYWHATLAMSADHPWLGAGPGNFQDRYLSYRLDDASEAIADPHNWFMETLASGGWPALVLWCAAIVSGIVVATAAPRWSRVRPAGGEPASTERVSSEPASVERGLGGSVAIGAATGFLFALQHWLARRELAFDPVMLGLIGVVVLLLMWRKPEQPPALGRPSVAGGIALSGAVAMGVHWLAAGGWTVPGLALPWIVLAGLATAKPPALADPQQSAISQTGPVTFGPVKFGAFSAAGMTRGFIAAVLLVAWLVTAWWPVSSSRDAMQVGQAAYQTGRFAEARGGFSAASLADAWDPVPAVRLAEVEMWLAMRAGTTSTRATWLESLRAAQRRNPSSPQLAVQLADQHLSMYQRFGMGEDLERAAEALTRAIELSGSEEQHVAQRALVLRELGQPQRAAEDWQRAEQLSLAGGHTERDLKLVQVLAVESIGEAVMRTGPRRLSARAAWQVPGR